MNVKNKNVIKIILDIIMSALLVLMFNKNVISLDFHEIGGLFLCCFILIHKLLNWKWIVAVSKKIFSKDLAFKLRFSYIIDFLLLISMTTILVSGISISKVVFTGISLPGGNFKVLHYFASALSLILVGIHIGLHWGFVMGMFKKYVKIPAAIAKPISIILVIAVVLFGSYSMFTSNFSRWLTAPFTTNNIKGRQPPADFDFKTDVSDSSTSNSTIDSNVNSRSQSTDNIQQNQQSQDRNQNSTNKTKPGNKAFGKGERPSGEDFHPKGERMAPDGKSFPSGGKHGPQGGSSNVLSVILSFTSIIGFFAAITYYCEKLLRRSKKRSQVIIEN